MRRRTAVAGKRRQLAFGLLLLLGLLLLATFSRPSRNGACGVALPRVVSHRGFDSDGRALKAGAATVEALLRAGVRSFDLDLFWTSDDLPEFYVGHPPSLLAHWGALPSRLCIVCVCSRA